MIQQGTPVRVKLVDGSNHAGLVVEMDEFELTLQCIYKFVDVQTIDGWEDKVLEVLSKLPTKNLLLIAIDLGCLKECLAGLGIARRKGLLSVLSTAMMKGMEPELIAQQSPVNKVFPIGSVLEISSLIDEGQEKFFERLAGDG